MFHAYQIPPEYQESPLYTFRADWRDALRDLYPGVSIFGNRDFSDAWSEEADGLREKIEDAAEAWEEAAYTVTPSATQRGRWEYTRRHSLRRDPYNDNKRPTLREILEDYRISRKDGKSWTTKQRHAWRAILEALIENPRYDMDDATADALELITGEKYETGTIRGCVQRDWARVIYPARMEGDGLRALEIEFFNMGEDYKIFDREKDDEEAEYIVNCYCYSWDDDKKRAELADAAGCRPEEITLHPFTGWSRSACYA